MTKKQTFYKLFGIIHLFMKKRREILNLFALFINPRLIFLKKLLPCEREIPYNGGKK
jgi:hypothetical protein